MSLLEKFFEKIERYFSAAIQRRIDAHIKYARMRGENIDTVDIQRIEQKILNSVLYK